MPRPDRIRLREKKIAGAVDDDAGTVERPADPPLNRKEEIAVRRTLKLPPVENDGEEATLDKSGEVNQPVRTGQVAQDDDFIASLAKRLGHKPKEEWDRAPDKWVDPKSFLEQTPQLVETLKDRLKRLGQVADEQAEQARQEALAQARAELQAAVKTGDEEAANAAIDKVAKTAGPPPQTVKWLSANPWFKTDPDAQLLAANAMRRAEQAGASIEDQLLAGETAARKRFPEHFDDYRPEPAQRREPEPEPKREVRLSEVRQPPPVLHEGSRGGRPQAPKEKGWNEIPAADRTQMTQFVKKAMKKGLTEAEATGRLARTYWEVKG